MDRRAFLATTGSSGLALLAGCSSSNSGGSSGQASTSASKPQQTTASNSSQFSRTVTIQWNAWKGRKFQITRPGTVSVSAIVRKGPAVDFYTVSDSELQAYKKQERFRYYQALSATDSASMQGSHQLGSGHYAFVVDNTTAGQAAGGEPVTVHFSLSL